MSKYITQDGDTFEIISRKVYGREDREKLLRSANPGAIEPLIAGLMLITPLDSSAPKNAPQVSNVDNPDEVSVVIASKHIRFFTGYRIIQSMDSFSRIELTAPNEPGVDVFDVIKPFGYEPIEVSVGGQLLFSGTVISVMPVLSVRGNTVLVKAYARPGVLNDCTAPASMAPLEFLDQTIAQIAATVAEPFGITTHFTADAGPAFETVALNPGKKILAFLAKLASQRDLVITNDERGDLVFQQSAKTSSLSGIILDSSIKTSVPVASLTEGQSPLVSVTPAFKPQEYYSHISGIEPMLIGLSGLSHTVINERLTGVFRPLTFSIDDINDGGVEKAVKAKMGRMFANMASYTVVVSTWRDAEEKLWTPNTTILLEAPRAMIPSSYEFIIRSVELVKQSTESHAKLNLILPGSFSGAQPERLPWEA